MRTTHPCRSEVVMRDEASNRDVKVVDKVYNSCACAVYVLKRPSCVVVVDFF